MSRKIALAEDDNMGTPRTYIKSVGSVTFKTEDVREVAESLLMRSILGLIEVEGFVPLVQWVHPRLNWADPKEIIYALKSLSEFGMLRQGSDGKYISIEINFDDYLSHSENLNAQYLFSTELGQLIRKNPDVINTLATGTYLWNEEIYKKFAAGIGILIEQANMEARNIAENDMLVGFNFSMTEVTRPLPDKSFDKGE